MKYKFRTKPYNHQLAALEKSWNKKEYGYFMEMGTGKTKVLIDNMSMLYDKGKIDGALIVAPKGVYTNWLSQEIPIHLVKHIKPKMVLWTATSSKKKEQEYATLFKPDYDLHILIMNVEAFSTKKGVEFAYKFLRTHKTLMTIDESTTIKNPSAKRTKSILMLGKQAKYRRILTGSPVTKSPLDLYSQCAFLNEELLGHASYYSFRNRYAQMIDRNFGGRRVQIVGSYQRLDELEEILKEFSYRVQKKDCLPINYCRLCNSHEIKKVFDLGKTPLANSYTKKNLSKKLKKYPLGLNLCNKCGHLQLTHSIKPEKMFSNYLYQTNTSNKNFLHFKDYALEVSKLFKKKKW